MNIGAGPMQPPAALGPDPSTREILAGHVTPPIMTPLGAPGRYRYGRLPIDPGCFEKKRGPSPGPASPDARGHSPRHLAERESVQPRPHSPPRFLCVGKKFLA
eukprot:jgi/Mesvir1/26165/Mv26363-RA.1